MHPRNVRLNKYIQLPRQQQQAGSVELQDPGGKQLFLSSQLKVFHINAAEKIWEEKKILKKKKKETTPARKG